MIFMKDNRIISAFSPVVPDAEGEARMRQRIMKKARRNDARIFRYAVPALAVAAGIFFFLPADKPVSVTLPTGDVLTYQTKQASTTSLMFDFPVVSRELTEEEMDAVFPEGGSRYAYASFDEKTGDLVHLEGRVDAAKLVIAAKDMPLNDTVIVTDTSVSLVQGIPVTGGTFTTKDGRTAIFFAEFALHNARVYVELADAVEKAEQTAAETGRMVLAMIEKEGPDLAAVHLAGQTEIAGSSDLMNTEDPYTSFTESSLGLDRNDPKELYEKCDAVVIARILSVDGGSCTSPSTHTLCQNYTYGQMEVLRCISGDLAENETISFTSKGGTCPMEEYLGNLSDAERDKILSFYEDEADLPSTYEDFNPYEEIMPQEDHVYLMYLYNSPYFPDDCISILNSYAGLREADLHSAELSDDSLPVLNNFSGEWELLGEIIP